MCYAYIYKLKYIGQSVMCTTSIYRTGNSLIVEKHIGSSNSRLENGRALISRTAFLVYYLRTYIHVHISIYIYIYINAAGIYKVHSMHILHNTFEELSDSLQSRQQPNADELSNQMHMFVYILRLTRIYVRGHIHIIYNSHGR